MSKLRSIYEFETVSFKVPSVIEKCPCAASAELRGNPETIQKHSTVLSNGNMAAKYGFKRKASIQCSE
jgi:hypothetical protein